MVESREEYLEDIEGNLGKISDDYIHLDINIVKEAVKSLKNGRAAGIGDVPAELLKNGTNNNMNY